MLLMLLLRDRGQWSNFAGMLGLLFSKHIRGFLVTTESQDHLKGGAF